MKLVDGIKACMSNNGGWNYRRSRFAGNLSASPSPEHRLALLHSLIFRNGVRKTTDQSRNTETLQRLLAGRLASLDEVSVIDVGCSSGADAIGTVAMLEEQTRVARYVLADLHTSIIVDEARGRVYSEDGDLLQLTLGPAGFFCTNFSYNFPWQRQLAIPQRVLAKLLTAGHSEVPGGKLVSLVDPRLADSEGLQAPFEQLRFDVFGSSSEATYDVVICLHLLVARYFSEEKIQLGVENLKRFVKPGGWLVCGDREQPLFLRRSADGVGFEQIVS